MARDDRIGCMLTTTLLWFPSRVNFDLTAYIDRHAMFSPCILSKLAFRIPSVIFFEKRLLGWHSRLHIHCTLVLPHSWPVNTLELALYLWRELLMNGLSYHWHALSILGRGSQRHRSSSTRFSLTCGSTHRIHDELPASAALCTPRI